MPFCRINVRLTLFLIRKHHRHLDAKSNVTLQNAILTVLKDFCKFNGNKKNTQQTKPPQNLRLPSSNVQSHQYPRVLYYLNQNIQLVCTEIQSFVLQIKKIFQGHHLFSPIPRSGKASYFNGHVYDHSILMVMYVANQNKT